MRINVESTTSLNKLAEQSRSIRSRYEPQWYMNLAFFLGDQWVFWNRGRLDKPVIPRHRILLTENRIMPVVLTRLARKTKQRPTWTCTPNSPSDSDVDGAELATTVVEAKYREFNMQDKLFTALGWADICSAGFWKTTWDSTLGEKVTVVVDDQGQPIQGQDGRIMRADQIPPALMQMQRMQTKTISEGEVVVETRSPFEILPDPLGSSIEDCEWIIEEVIQSEDYVKDHYGVTMTGDTEVSAGPADSRYFPSFQQGGSSSYKGVKVRELWMKPSATFEKGKRVVWAKDKILLSEDNPYECLPYVMFKGAPIPGRFWPSSIVEQLREPQIELNKIKSQIRENAQRIGNPSLLRDRFSNTRYSGVPGEDVMYDSSNPNSIPRYLEPPNMPPYVIEEIDRIENAIQEISGQHEVTGAQVPAGVTAASAINLLLEQDDTRLGPTISEMETQLGYAGRMVLELIAEYYTEERMLKVTGPDSNYDFVSFKGEMLHGNTAVEVQAGSSFPSSKAAKQAAIGQYLTLFLQNGMQLDPRTMRRLVRDYQVGGLEAFVQDTSRDIAQVNREHRLMYLGQPLPINTYDDDDIHIAEHMDQMKSSKFFRADSNIQAIMLAHLQLHQQRVAVKQQQAMEQQQAAMDQAAVHQGIINSRFQGEQQQQDFQQQVALHQLNNNQNQGGNNNGG
jgi:hypothetical protein